MLQQVCGAYGEESCGWKGEPYTPPRKRITNTTDVRVDDFSGWHYIVYDKYGHVQTDSATHNTRAEAMKELERDLTPKQGYDDPSAPLTAVLFFVPANFTIEGTMYRFNKGGVNRVAPQAEPVGDDEDAEYYCWHGDKPFGPGPYCTGCGGLIKTSRARCTNSRRAK